MKRLIALVLICLAFNAFASLEAYVEEKHLQPGQPIHLVLEADSDAIPDFSVLQQNFRVLGHHRMHQVRVINGVRKESYLWQLSILPMRGQALGENEHMNILVPSIQVGKEKTQSIEVTYQEAGIEDGESQIKLNSSVSTHTPFVGQEVIYTVILDIPKALEGRLSNMILTEPDAVDILWRPLPDVRSEGIEIDGTRYERITRHFALFPEKPGQVRLPGVMFSGEQHIDAGHPHDPLRQIQHLAFMTTQAKPLHAQADPQDLTVQAVPEHTGPWLPARGLKLTQSWSTDQLDQVKEGDLITRTVRIEAEGLQAAYLPSLPEQLIDGVSVYPSQPESKDDVRAGHIVGESEQKIAYLMASPGRFIIPAWEVQYWNTQTDRFETVTLPEQTIGVEKMLSQEPSQPGLADSAALQEVSTSPWKWVSVVFGMLWLLTLSAFLLYRYRHRFSGFSRFKRPVSKRRQLEDMIEKALLADEYSQAVEAILAWGQYVFKQPCHSLADVSHCISSPELQSELNILKRLCYAEQEECEFNVRRFTILMVSEKYVSRKNRKPSLPPLFPS